MSNAVGLLLRERFIKKRLSEAVVGAACLLGLVGWTAAGLAQTTAVPANDFLDSMAVNTHVAQGLSWANYTNRLVYLGLRSVRDGATTNSARLNGFYNVHRVTGVQVELVGADMNILTNCAIALAASNALLAIEGPNEPNNFPLTYEGALGGGTGLPGGLAVDTGTGILSGTPTGAGTYALALKASNASGARWAVLTLIINGNASAPLITNQVEVTGTTNSAFSLQILATQSPTSYGAAHLPPGLSINTGTGEITGTPTQAGNWPVAITAVNASGSTTAFLTIVIDGDPALPVITSPVAATASTGNAFSYQIVATQSPTSYNAQKSWIPVADFQRDLYATVKASPQLSSYPVFHVSEGAGETDNVGMQWLTIATNAGCVLPDGTQFADFANPHNYVCGTKGTWTNNAAWMGEEPATNGLNTVDGLYNEYGVTWKKGYTGYTSNQLVSLPKVTSETGWQSTNLPYNVTLADGTTRLSETNQAHLYLNLYLDAYKRGWSHTSIYELRDGEGGAWVGGMYRNDWTAKPAATYLHNLTTILADSTSIAPGSVNYSISNQTETVHDLLLQKSDGTFYLAVWDERTDGVDNVAVNLTGELATTALQYDPTVGTNVLQTWTNVTSIPLAVSNHVVFLAMTVAPILPSADFTGSPTSGVLPLEVNFTDLSDGSPSSWSWSFGDGGTSGLQNPAYTYTTAGVYTVQLIAINDNGSSTNTKSGYITALQLPAGWTNQDIGTVGVAGSASYSGGTFTVSGSGDDIYNVTDAFHYAYQTYSGDCTATVHVATSSAGNSNAKVGIMIRSDLSSTSPFAMMCVTPSPNVRWIYRRTSGTSASQATASGVSVPCWLRLVRTGNDVKGYRSSDGVTWTPVGSKQTISLGTTAYIGLPVCSHDNGTLATATMDNVTIVSP